MHDHVHHNLLVRRVLPVSSLLPGWILAFAARISRAEGVASVLQAARSQKREARTPGRTVRIRPSALRSYKF